jgi:tRNA-Thr(GGU) m(6)t(6)A37 methyltransferase TsaA
MNLEVTVIGHVRSSLMDRKDAPRQSWKDAPQASIDILPQFAESLDGLEAGQEIWLLTWLHQSERNTLKVRPGHDPNNPIQGVFATRSPDRPTPVGLHRVRIVAIAGQRIDVDGLEAINDTPVIDIKPAIEPTECF